MSRELRKPGYSVWKELMSYLGFGELDPVSDDYVRIKACLKTALYSVVYGMKREAVASVFASEMRGLADGTRDEADALSDEAIGWRLMRHWLVRSLVTARDRELKKLTPGTVLDAPTEIRIVVGDDEGAARSAMATLAQSYEQALMSVVLEYEEEHHETTTSPTFRVMLWIHDGCYVHFTRSRQKHVDELKRRLAARAAELGVYAEFEVEDVSAPASETPAC